MERNQKENQWNAPYKNYKIKNKKENTYDRMKNILVLLMLAIASQSLSQNLLSLPSAKAITLENNFGIQIAKNELEIAKNLTDRKANGYLPIVTADAGLNGNVGSASQNFSNGLEASTTNAFNWGANASLGANYTIFDKRRDLTLDQLNQSVELSDLQLKQTIEQNLLTVYTQYYQVLQLSDNIEFLEEAISISEDRLKRAQYSLDLGQGDGLAVLNVTVDIQRDSVNLLNAQMNLETAKRNLNVAMGRSADTEFEVNQAELISNQLDLENLIDKAKTNNTNLEINKLAINVNSLNLDILDAEKKPTVFAGLSYGLNYSDNATGSFIDQSNSRGLNGNVGLSWTLFDGSRDVRAQNAVLNIQNQKLQLQNLEQILERDIRNAWANYQNAIFVLEVERKALDTNEENFKRTEERVRVGQLSSIEFRQAQLNLLTAQVSLSNAKINAKVNELELLQLAGLLLSDN